MKLIRVDGELGYIQPVAEIHTTDVEAFAQCRRKWDWQSSLRQGLQRASLPPPLLLGQGVHIGLEEYWSTGRDIHAALDKFGTWMDERVQAVQDWSGAPLWESEKSAYIESRQLGRVMLLHYHLWCGRFADQFEIVATEQKFDLPLTGQSWSKHLQPPQPPRLPAQLPLALSGRFDGVVRRKRDGATFLLEFKTSARLQNVKWMFRGLQGPVYTWAAQQLYPDVQGILYQVMRKKIPDQPKPLKRGGFSRAKNQDTSLVFYRYCLNLMADKSGTPLVELESGARDFLTILAGRGNPFFFQVDKHQPQARVDSAMRTLYYLARQMTDPKIPIFAMSSFWCNNCAFKDPCALYETGGDYKALLDAEYAPRTYWEDRR